MRFSERLRLRFVKPSPDELSKIAAELVQSTLKNSLSRKIIESLKRSAKWPFDIGNRSADETERVILDLWSTSDTFIRSDPGKLDAAGRDAFLDEMHQIAYQRLAEIGMSEALRRELSQRSQQRYPEYAAAYDLFWHEYPNPDALDQGGWMVKAFMPLTRVVSRSLFGHESKDIEASSRIITLVNVHFVVISKELKSQSTHRRIARALRAA